MCLEVGVMLVARCTGILSLRPCGFVMRSEGVKLVLTAQLVKSSLDGLPWLLPLTSLFHRFTPENWAGTALNCHTMWPTRTCSPRSEDGCEGSWFWVIFGEFWEEWAPGQQAPAAMPGLPDLLLPRHELQPPPLLHSHLFAYSTTGPRWRWVVHDLSLYLMRVCVKFGGWNQWGWDGILTMTLQSLLKQLQMSARSDSYSTHTHTLLLPHFSLLLFLQTIS